GPDVGAHLERLLRPPPADIGQVEAIADAADQVAAQHLDALLVLEEGERLFEDLEWQTDQLGQVQAEHPAARVQRAQQHVTQKTDRQPRLLQRFRRPGRLGQVAQVPVGGTHLGVRNHGCTSTEKDEITRRKDESEEDDLFCLDSSFIFHPSSFAENFFIMMNKATAMQMTQICTTRPRRPPPVRYFLSKSANKTSMGPESAGVKSDAAALGVVTRKKIKTSAPARKYRQGRPAKPVNPLMVSFL